MSLGQNLVQPFGQARRSWGYLDAAKHVRLRWWSLQIIEAPARAMWIGLQFERPSVLDISRLGEHLEDRRSEPPFVSIRSTAASLHHAPGSRSR